MKDVIYFIKQMYAYAGVNIYINMVSMTFIGVLESVGIMLLVPMISITGLVDFGIEHDTVKNYLELIESVPIYVILPCIMGIYLSIVIGYNFLDRKILIRNTIIQTGFLRKIRTDVYSSLLRSNWEFFVKNRKSDIINVAITEVTKASNGTSAVLNFIGSFLFTIIQIALALWLSPSITIFVLLCGVILIFVNRKMLKRAYNLGKKNLELNKELFAGITDQINGIKDIKSNLLEETRLDWFHNVSQNIVNEQIELSKLRTRTEFHFKNASVVFVLIFIFVSIMLFEAEAGELLLIIAIFSRLWPRVMNIQGSLERIMTAIPSLRAVKDLQQECFDFSEFTTGDYQHIEPLQLENAIQLQNIYFRYDTSKNRFALKDLSIVIPANQMTAVVGQSGAGKSTLIDLIMGLNHPEAGQVFLDGEPLIKEKVLSLRKSLGYVPQDPFVFNTTIRENLKLVKEDASEEEIWDALTLASADDFVKKLPDALDTLIGDRGIKLSGGERQRLVLTRAILRKPSILVLDEATSALDAESESKIQKSLESLKGHMTIIVIAHRLSTIRNADQVIVLDNGKVIQQGGFVQLSQEKNKVFNLLLNKQLENIQ